MYDVDKIRDDFLMLKNNSDLIYFDNGATSFKPKCVVDKVVEFYTSKTSNIHRGDYDLSFLVSKEYDETKKTIKEFINAKSINEIVFTSGATASLNTVAYGLSDYFKKDDVILTSLVEHASDILPWFRIAKEKGVLLEYIPLNDDGTFNLAKFEKCFENKKIKLVSLTYVSNVLGYKYPIKEICAIAHKYGALVNVDGAQAVPHFKVDVSDLDVDFLSFSAHKMLGPSGVGVLYGKYELLENMKPMLLGGGANARFEKDLSVILKEAPDKYEAGTPNIEGVLGLNMAIKYLTSIGMENIEVYEKELVLYMLNKLNKLDNVIIYNNGADSAIVAFNVKGIFAQDVGTYLNKNNIAVRTGNHCAKLLHNVIGATESVRASLYLYNTKEEIDKFIDVLKDISLEKCIGALL